MKIDIRRSGLKCPKSLNFLSPKVIRTPNFPNDSLRRNPQYTLYHVFKCRCRLVCPATMQATTMNYFLAVYYMLIYVVSSFFFFQKVAFWRPIFGKKLGKKFGRKKNEGWGCVGWGGRRINKTGYNVLPFLNVSLHCFDEQN